MKFSREPEPDVLAAAPPRRRRWLRWIVLPLLLLGLAVAGWTISANSGLSSAVAEADREDPHWRLADLEARRPDYPDAENAALIVAALKRAWPANVPDAVRFDTRLQELQSPQQLNERQQEAVKKLLDAYAEALPIARSLRRTPRGRHPVNWAPDGISTLLLVQDNRHAAQVLRYDVMALAQAGDGDEAIRSCHACFHAGCSIGEEPLLISQLVRIACQAVAVGLVERTLAQTEPSPAVLKELQERIEAEEPAPLLLYGARGERAMSNQFFEALRSGKVTGATLGGIMGTGPGAGVLDWLVFLPGFVASQHTSCLHFTNAAVEIAKLPPEQWVAPLIQLRGQLTNMSVLARMLAPAMDKVAQACQRNHAALRCTIVALAMERHRKEKGRWAESLAELVEAGYLKAVPTDPYDGRPLRLLRTDEGWVIYTVGPDTTDDGGRLNPQNPTQAGTDQGLRLWDPAKRRQPAPPIKPDPDEPTPAPPEAPAPPAPDQ